MLVFALLGALPFVYAAAPTVRTTSGILTGTRSSGVNAFKGIRFAQPPVGSLRWAPPVAFASITREDTTVLPPSCIQQFTGFRSTQNFTIAVFDTPPPPGESEDCLFINVWAPTTTGAKPVMVWFFGGAHEFGSGSVSAYDGTSMAKNQNIVHVTLNYRTNVFGFPVSPDLPLAGNNLGYLDQELALAWVQDNIAAFGGDPTKVTIMGQSAGAQSVSDAVSRHTPAGAPFRAGIMLSGASVSTVPVANFTPFNSFAAAVGCSQSPGAARLQCLRAVPAATIRAFINGPDSAGFGTTVVDGVTVFADPLQRIRTGLTARKPIIIGNMENDGTVFALGQTNLTAFLDTMAGGLVSADMVRALYSGMNDSLVIADAIRDLVFRCPASLWSAAFVGSGMPNVFRYSYGAVFADTQAFPGAGAWHSSELPELFGTFNATTASPSEVTLSSTFQTAFANFIKNPTASPATNWPMYVPGNITKTLAKLAYKNNVNPGDFVQAVQSDSLEGPCALFNTLLDFRV